MIEIMKRMFIGIEIAFNKCKPANRKCMVHYNFIFVRILQILGKPEFFKYFPLLKSKTKVKIIDDVWKRICECMGLDVPPSAHTENVQESWELVWRRKKNIRRHHEIS